MTVLNSTGFAIAMPDQTQAYEHRIRFILGSRQLFCVRRNLRIIPHSLDDILQGRTAPLEPLEPGQEGYLVVAMPRAGQARLLQAYPDFLAGGLKAYSHSCIDMTGSFADYLAGFSPKTRETFRRKTRRVMARSGGALDIREYRTPAEVDEFRSLALAVSQKTYQARLLEAGLPADEPFHQAMLDLAACDRVRAFLLFVEGQPVSYLYLPVDNDVLRYAYLGYDPAFGALSVGTVLQLQVLERLFAEKRFRYFDFTEGEGDHKTLFGTSSLPACSFFLLRPSWSNRLLLMALAGFEAFKSVARQLVRLGGLSALLRRVLRR